MNCRSAVSKSESINNYIQTSKFDFACLTETWITTGDTVSPQSICPSSYNFTHVSRKSRSGGGLALLHKKSISVSIVKATGVKSFEILHCILSFNGPKLRLMVIYYPGYSLKHKFTKHQFTEEFREIISPFTVDPLPLIIMGDFNIHVTDVCDRDTNEFLEMLKSVDLVQHVNFPTRGNEVLDLVLTKSTDSVLNYDSLYADWQISDHTSVCGNLNIAKLNPIFRKVSYRKIKSVNIVSFLSELNTSITCLSDVKSVGTSDFNDMLRNILDSYAPLKSALVVDRDLVPWFSDELKFEKRIRRRKERIWRRSKAPEDWAVYKEECKIFESLFQSSKSNFMIDEINRHRNDYRFLFRLSFKLMGSDKERESPLPQHVSKHDLANRFAAYFVDKVQTISNSFSGSSYLPNVPLLPVLEELTKFESMHPSGLKRLIDQMTVKTCEMDPLPTSLYKESIVTLTPLITSMINESFNEVCFPDSLKKAVVRPLLKKSTLDQNTLSNYRPVSNISFLSKVYEKVMYKQISDHLEINNLRDPFQSAYRLLHSPETALTRVKNDLLLLLDEGKVALLIMLDLSAAFDTINHDLLLQKLQNLGIVGDALNYIRTYLTGRTQQVIVGSEYSDCHELKTGVPQGSLLGPLLFSIYTRDLGLKMSTFDYQYHLFADDNQLYLGFLPESTTSWYYRTEIANVENCLSEVKDWLSENRLKLNESKTEVLLLGHKRVTESLSRVLSIQLADEKLKSVDVVRNLGVLFDSELSMAAHVDKTRQTALLHLRNISRIRKYITLPVAKSLITSLVLSRLDYCNSLLAGCPGYLTKRLQLVQNFAARVVLRKRRRDHITPLLIKLHFLPVQYRIQHKIISIVHRAIYRKQPKYILDLLSFHTSLPFLRSATDHFILNEPQPKSQFGRRAFSFIAPHLWNCLPYTLRSVSSEIAFRRQLKTYLFSQAFQ